MDGPRSSPRESRHDRPVVAPARRREDLEAGHAPDASVHEDVVDRSGERRAGRPPATCRTRRRRRPVRRPRTGRGPGARGGRASRSGRPRRSRRASPRTCRRSGASPCATTASTPRLIGAIGCAATRTGEPVGSTGSARREPRRGRQRLGDRVGADAGGDEQGGAGDERGVPVRGQHLHRASGGLEPLRRRPGDGRRRLRQDDDVGVAAPGRGRRARRRPPCRGC